MSDDLSGLTLGIVGVARGDDKGVYERHVELPALCLHHLAVVRSLRNQGYTVAHIESGWPICNLSLYLPDALAAARALEALDVPWAGATKEIVRAEWTREQKQLVFRTCDTFLSRSIEETDE